MIYAQNASFSQRSHESRILLKVNIQNEQNIFFLKLNILLKVSIFLVTKPFQTTETWKNLTKDRKTLQKVTKLSDQ